MKIGVLGIQGAIQEHLSILRKAGVEPSWVKDRKELDSVMALVMPGGESTTMIKLLKRFEMWETLRDRIEDGMPVLATCAGMILLSKTIENVVNQDSLGVLDISVKRNGYGRQINSFEVDLQIDEIGPEPFRAVFIRAPKIESICDEVRVLTSYEELPVLVRQGNVLAASFHPELTGDLRIHRYFLKMAEAAGQRIEKCAE
ncbi:MULTISPECIES: pyridoxal 5'-phosphate synthase glutaminase subunit PdxT [unclassified Mesotoga]|uniref:pyridoxal 5'-phosphate synthase glutaminase subunit PdxT n=1 Tax=unclassified Mesotoga TaxID=1184398 RepID=UPI000EF282ED|nr:MULTISPECIES: pyridoxal 5'-phosphate synthase glutaminase subunit PdxT [unclassified Mesotoga]NLT45783.1 pyridoxal 5'-phosphate synthase glutaminase subunit PdxT [Thermotogaceae bacterium]MDD3680746.1 pyridoxal 5'-phosphate synthase glutaminase subunit PdxT [Mesotoga sp.]MDD4208269.1 pyridoxal 5'-phosphate synthase glutaminase subunit PdxT [Mesotoga sp.]MDD5682906.1 pyridoxal 5'-phosphate synthase glutaminase subunit PdxT [Mesotoga sp.]RLL82024.1 glutamine amidotransferase [Mesotoga sp. BH4